MPNSNRPLAVVPLEDRTVPATGALDLVFGGGGFAAVPHDLYSASPTVKAFGVATVAGFQPGGQIVLAGLVTGDNLTSAFDIARLTAAGAADPSFGLSGHDYARRGTVAFSGFGAAVRADGSVVAAALAAGAGSTEYLALSHVTAAGAPDATFGTAGDLDVPLALPPGQKFAAGRDADVLTAVSPGGSIVVVGSRAATATRLIAARVTAAGALDVTFGTLGVANNPLAATFRPAALAVLPDGRVVVVGSDTVGGVSVFAAVRLTAAGALDAAFGTGGEVIVPVGATAAANAVAVQSDGDLVVGGPATVTGTATYAVTRLTPTGAVDSTFGTSGTTLFVGATGFNSVAVQADGKLVLAGTDAGNPAAARLTAAGGVDGTFGVGGVGHYPATLPAGDSNPSATGVVLQPDGKALLYGGFAASDFTTGLLAARLTNDAVPPAVTLAPSVVPALTAGAAASVTFTESGAVGTPTFVVSAGGLPPGLALDAAGHLTGVPSPGLFGFTVTATDGAGNAASQAYALTVAPGPVAVGPATLPDGFVGDFGYLVPAFTAPGPFAAAGTYTFQVTAPLFTPSDGSAAVATLDGLTLLGSKLIGQPAAAGTLTFTVTASATDTAFGAASGSRSYTVHYAPNPIRAAADPARPLYFHNGVAQTTRLTFSSTTPIVGVFYYDFNNFTSSTGLTVTTDSAAGTATVSGTPKNFGGEALLTVQDQQGVTASFNYTVTVLAAGALELTASPATGTVVAQAGVPFSGPGGVGGLVVRAAGGGGGPVSFRLVSGGLPPGLALVPGDGVGPTPDAVAVAGTPAAAGEFLGTLLATDPQGFTASIPFDLVVTGAAAPGVAVGPNVLPVPTVGVAYAASLVATGGAGSATFVVSDGALPAGLTLSAAGQLSGVPTASAVSTFTVAATDAVGAVGRRVYVVGVLPVVAKLAVAFTNDGTPDIGSGVPALSVGFEPGGVTLDAAGNVYVTDKPHLRVRRVDVATGLITSVAGTGSGINLGPDGVPATSSQIDPTTVAIDAAGNLYFEQFGIDSSSNPEHSSVRKVNAVTGVITTVAGGSRPDGFSGDGGPAVNAALGFHFGGGVAADAAGNVYIGDTANNRVRRVDAVTGVITTVAGTGTSGFTGDGGLATAAKISSPARLAVDAAGNLYFGDGARVRRVDAVTGVVTTVAGTGTLGFSGDGGPATAAKLSGASGIAVDRLGNLFLAESVNHRVRRVDGVTGVITTVAGSATPGFFGVNLDFVGEGGPATAAVLGKPTGVAVDAAGNLTITDSASNRIVAVDGRTGLLRTVAGTGGQSFGGEGGPVGQAAFSQPAAEVFDAAGNAYLADAGNNVVRRVDALTGVVTTVAGTGTAGFSGDGGLATAARLKGVNGVAVDAAGNLFLSDAGNSRVRRVDVATGVITTFAGNGASGALTLNGDGGPATAAGVGTPVAVALDPAGNLLIASFFSIRRVDARTGIITTIAGNGDSRFAGDGVPATATGITASALAVDPAGNVYFADAGNLRVRRIDATGLVTTVAGSGRYGFAGDGGPATAAQFVAPAGLALDRDGNLFILDNFRVREVYAATGILNTVAGGGPFSNAIPGPARDAILDTQNGLALDPAGDLHLVGKFGGLLRAYPSLRLDPLAAGSPGVAYSVSFKPPTATGITYSATGLPSWATLDPSTGVLSGTPPAVGTFSFTVTSAVGIIFNGAFAGSTVDQRDVTLAVLLGQAVTFAALPPVTYGATPVALSATGGASGNPVAFTVISGPGTVIGTTLAVNGAGDVVVEARQDGTATFAPAPVVRQTLRVAPAPLRVTADSVTATADGAFPALTFRAIGFVNWDTAASLTGSLTTPATSASPPGNYPIIQGTLAGVNYAVTFVAGTLTVVAPPVVPPVTPPIVPPVTPPVVALPVNPPVTPPSIPPIVMTPVPPPTPVGVRLRAVGADTGGGPRVRAFHTDGSVAFDAFAFEPTFTGGVRVASADLNGDGVDDVVAGAGDGGGPRVRVFDGATGRPLLDFFAFEDALRVGAFVAAADLNGDGHADILVGAGHGGGPRVAAFDGVTGARLFDFFAFDPDDRNGVTVAIGDVTGSGRPEVVVGQLGGGSRVRVFDLAGQQLAEFDAYEPTFTGGVYVAVGDPTGDGSRDILTGAGPGGGPRVLAFAVSATGTMTQVGNSFPFDQSGRDGVRVGTGVGPDGRPTVVVGVAGKTVSVRPGRTPAAVTDLAPFGDDYLGGVWVS